jgi:hypothetical protein
LWVARGAAEDGDQKHRSRHHRAFLDPETGKMLLADNARRLREGLLGQGVPAEALEQHLSVLGNPDALEAALAWYRANVGLAAEIGTIRVLTLYIWGDEHVTVGPSAAHGTAEFVTATFAMVVLGGVGHFVMDQASVRATELMLEHMRRLATPYARRSGDDAQSACRPVACHAGEYPGLGARASRRRRIARRATRRRVVASAQSRDGRFPNRGNPNVISAQTHSFRAPLRPAKAGRVFYYRPNHLFGVATNRPPVWGNRRPVMRGREGFGRERPALRGGLDIIVRDPAASANCHIVHPPRASDRRAA